MTLTSHRWRIAAAIMVPVALLVSLIAWGFSSPPGSSPDDDYHMASIWCANGVIPGQCERAASVEQRELPADLVYAANCFAFQPGQPASCPRHEGEMRPTERGNWVGHAYPPGFYVVMSMFVGPSLSTSIVLMRSFNAVLYVGLMTALFFLLPRRQRPPLVWGAAVSLVPLGTFLIPSTNPSSWAVISATGLWVATWGFFESTGTRRRMLGGMAALLLLIGAGARADAAAYGVLAVIVGATLGWRRTRGAMWAALLPLALVVVAGLLFLSGGQSSVVSGETTVHNKEFAISTLIFINAKLLPGLWSGALGGWGLGWLDTWMPAIVTVPALGVFAAFTFWGLKSGGARKWVALLAVGAALVFVPMYILVHDGITVGTGVQPRYIYPLLIMFAGVALVGLSSLRLGMRLPHMIVVVSALTIANAIALHTNMRRYITGTGVQSFNLNSPIDWWWNTPATPMVLWGMGTVAFAVGLMVLAWAALSPSSLQGTAPGTQ